MKLIRINDVVKYYDISSRTLRYYEEVGLLVSRHPDNSQQRYYDDAQINRLKQIIILRKLQIPIKSIAEILNSGDLTELTDSFIRKIAEIDNEIDALKDLRELVEEFLNKMKQHGIKKISAIELIYEETEKRLRKASEMPKSSTQNFKRITDNALKIRDVRIHRLPRMRMLTSYYKEEGYDDFMHAYDVFEYHGVMANPGMRDSFYVKKNNDVWILMTRIDDDFDNVTPYKDMIFSGGLFAVTTSFIEYFNDQSNQLIKYINESDLYDIDYDTNGKWRCDLMIEEILPHDISQKLNRYQQDIFIPVKTLF